MIVLRARANAVNGSGTPHSTRGRMARVIVVTRVFEARNRKKENRKKDVTCAFNENSDRLFIRNIGYGRRTEDR